MLTSVLKGHKSALEGFSRAACLSFCIRIRSRLNFWIRIRSHLSMTPGIGVCKVCYVIMA